MVMKRLIVLTALALAVAFPASAAAAEPSNPSCWGAATTDLAQSAPGAMGEHASSFDTPRLGIGNVAYLFTGTHQPGDLASALGFACN
jgi:hypothetical protein